MKISNIQFQISIIKYPIMVGLILASLCIASPGYAATASPSAKASPQSTASASLMQKINELKEKAASKAADLVSEITKKLQNKAYFGMVTSTDGEKILISFVGNNKTIATNEYTKISSTIKSAKKVTSLKDIVVGDFVSGLGDTDDKEDLKAKKLIKSSPIATDSSKLVWGIVQKVTGGTITIKLADSTIETVTSSGQTTVFLGTEEGSLLDVKVGRAMIARGSKTKNAGLSYSYIYVVPQSANAKPEPPPESTKSASPSATPKKSKT